MIFELNQLLTGAEVAELNAALEGQTFVDGRETALNEASLVKRNIQIPAGSELRATLSARLEGILLANSMFTTLVMPKRIGPFHFSRYEVGMTYGDHVDNSVMGLGTGDPMRADLSMSIFLNDPDDYDGGDLVLNSRLAPRSLKLASGDAIVYPTDEFHRVEPVTRGVRKVAITWIESLVRGAHRRQILTDIWTAMDGISKMTAPERLHENEAYRTLSKSHWSLLRLWAET
jgi:PKHD-type hydroxylase